MIHLAGNNSSEIIVRAQTELEIYEQEGVDGAIIENYHGTLDDVRSALNILKGKSPNLKLGVNILGSPYAGFTIARMFGASFVQFDTIQNQDINPMELEEFRRDYSSVALLGGIGFKYIDPSRLPLEEELRLAKTRCEAVVTTGSGTGKETPLKKLQEYKSYLNEFPLIVGAGVNLENAGAQLRVCDGAIIGSYFKPQGDTRAPVDRHKVRDLVQVVEELRQSL